ncbi:NAD(P)-dependent oxidoreductase [Thalassotalea euphylliae]|uniref:NAD(P)-dependent oxidoreductase n=1 Tax=Thalassotalea euphylliae TaxID=1655234 RepID=A0A3E0TQ56_9GAMM|nr:NAD(P)-dependent oxidoreductase [Thalassotalea euphylliae]REL26669.1 NAD(P)-dependent oxidoreductase [Thalassotalea euphylliae]
MANVAFIGLGVMGYPMAGHLAKVGHQVHVYNRTTSKAQQWVTEFGGEYFETPALAASGCEIVFSCVGNDDDVRLVCLGETGVLAGMSPGSVLVDHTTASAELARELANIANQQGVGFLDAPVSGGQAGAENGVLTVMLGGDQQVYDNAQPVMAAYSRFTQLMGDVGSGQLAKMVNQICIAGVVQGLAEAFTFADNAGLDPDLLVETISKGAAGSWQMENRYKTMFAGEYDFGFAVDWMRKDLAIAFAEAKKNGTALPMTEMIDGFYQEIQAKGGSRWDTSSLIARYKK